ncbi:hypothetical protein CHARACLAT_013930 [Characodon lateralis]|uniref:Uncharacterized protein n=1 Tax=Characodon lateralis TaxID=208331 RepID=A0ABU7D6I8_9TELE|nr:hypothetical protein [Characodon lateralis]
MNQTLLLCSFRHVSSIKRLKSEAARGMINLVLSLEPQLVAADGLSLGQVLVLLMLRVSSSYSGFFPCNRTVIIIPAFFDLGCNMKHNVHLEHHEGSADTAEFAALVTRLFIIIMHLPVRPNKFQPAF